MPFEIVRNDIVKMQVDAIVNTANPRPIIGSGTDAAIHAAAGPMLLHARKFIGTMNTGDVCITPGFKLPAKHVIHTIGPVWYDGSHEEDYCLRQCYERSLKLALRHRCKSIAFPLISTGNYGFPKKLALQIALETIRAFLEKHEMKIYLVLFSKESLELSGNLVEQVRSFIDDAYVQEKEKAEYGFAASQDFDFVRRRFEDTGDAAVCTSNEDLYDRILSSSEEEALPVARCQPEPTQNLELDVWDDEDLGEYSSLPKAPRRRSLPIFPRVAAKPKKPEVTPAFDPSELTRMVKEADAGFSETLLKLIDQSGQKDSDVYKRANVDRKLFSKIRNNPQYKPSKATAVAFAIALELDLEETRDFIGRAGYALSRSSTFDIIIEYFIVHERYDIYEINLTLFEFDQSLLGA